MEMAEALALVSRRVEEEMNIWLRKTKSLNQRSISLFVSTTMKA